MLKQAYLQTDAYFHGNFENAFKIKYCEKESTKKVIYTLQTALTIQINYQKEVKIYINASYCVTQL
jgi:hypothetical protein